MIHYKQPANGIDKAILKLLRFVHDGICCLYEIEPTGNSYQCYGRIYRNRPATGGGIVPERYIGGGEYQSVLPSDEFVLSSFCDVGDVTTINSSDNVVTLTIVFFGNLAGIKWRDSSNEAVSVPHRNDEEMRGDIQSIFDDALCGFTPERIVAGLDALSPYRITGNGTAERDPSRFNMHPYHVFSISGTLRYPKPTTFYNHNLNN